MRKFKLKKDLPGWPRGTILKLDDDMFLTESGQEIGLYSQTGNTEVALSKWATPIQEAPFSDWLEEIEPEYERWRAEKGEKYYIINSDATISWADENGSTYADDRYRLGNYFKTEEEAQALADYLKALIVVRDDAKGFKPDWSDPEQEKWGVLANHEAGKIVFAPCNNLQDNGIFGLPIFKDEDDAQKSIEKHEKEWKTIFGIKDEEEE